MYAIILVFMLLVVYPPIAFCFVLMLLLLWNPIVTILGIAFIIWAGIKISDKFGKKGKR